MSENNEGTGTAQALSRTDTMHARRAINIVFALVLGLAIFMPAARADIWEDQETWLIFDKPVRVSDEVVLPAGAYWFRLADSMSSPFDTVEILDNYKKHLATVLTRPTDRVMPRYRHKFGTNAEWTQIEIILARGSDKDTLIKWFYPGEHLGHKFLYSKHREEALSKEQIATVMVAR